MMMTRGMGSKRIDIQFHGHIKHEIKTIKWW